MTNGKVNLAIGNPRICLDSNWSFSKIKRRETLYASHGYHRYPAKFIPQLANKLIKGYSKKGDIVLDPMGGCGTTLVESKLNGRNSIGVDINRVAVLIAKTKTKAIEPNFLNRKNEKFLNLINNLKIKKNYYANANSRLKYWFKEENYNKLQSLNNLINNEKKSRIRLFYKCCFSNILKNCSIWYAKSIKPMRDLNKNEENPVEVFKKHLKFMTQKNLEFYELVKKSNADNYTCKMLKGDARNISIEGNSVDLIITSPPYVTSYEYADLHQLTSLWFNFANDISDIKRDFIGTSSRKNTRKKHQSPTAKKILKKIRKKNMFYWKNINNYYFDLNRCYSEMYRVLKSNKFACIILGDTEYLGVKITNKTVSIELLKANGFEIHKIVKRKLSSKIFTPYRDKSGRFTNSSHGNKRKIYQYEYIIIAKKIK